MSRQKILSKTRESLLTHAVKLFLKKGYERTSTRDIAKAVGIKAPGIYYYFKSKKEILHELNEESWRLFREMVLDQAKEASDPAERISLYIQNMIKYQLKLGEKTLILDDSVTVKNVGRRKLYEREVFDFLRDNLKELSQIKGTKNNHINATVATFALFNMVSKTYQWYKPKGNIGIEELGNQMVRLFFDGFLGGRK